jgi:DNA-binding beta-propeller fold protein YncE
MNQMWSTMKTALTLVAWIAALSTTCPAQLLVSANDGKVVLNNGVVEYVRDGKDSVTVIDIRDGDPKIVAELEAPSSVLCPPSNVAISPDRNTVLVASARKYEGDPAKAVSDDRLTFIDLQALRSSQASKAGQKAGEAPPQGGAVVTTLRVGAGASGVAINKAGTLALVANRDEGSVSLVSLAQRKVISEVRFDDDKSGPAAIAFTPDGTRALVTLYGPAAVPTGTKVAVLRIKDDQVELAGRMITTGFGPFSLDISRSGDIAVVANLGGGVTGDADVVSVIDLTQEPFKVVNSISVAPSPEGIKFSPDGQLLAVSSVNGTHRPKSSPFYNDAGVLQIYLRKGASLTKVAEAETGHWCQGVAWSKDSRRLYLQCMAEKEIQMFSFEPSEGNNLRPLSSLKINGGPAGLAVAYD